MARKNFWSALTALAIAEREQQPVNAAKLALAAWPRHAAMDIPKQEMTLTALSRSLASLHERMRITTNDVITSAALSPDGARVLTGSADKTARLWDIAAIPQGSLFDIACAWLPDYDLSSLGKDYGLDLSREEPICQKDGNGKY